MADARPTDCSHATNKANTCLLVLCGLPGSGKTSLAKALAREAAQAGVAVCIVNFDDLGCQPSGVAGSSGGSDGSGAAGQFCPEAWQQARQQALGALEAALSPCDSCSDGVSDAGQHQSRACVEAEVADTAVAAGPARCGADTQQQQQQQQPQQQQQQQVQQQQQQLQQQQQQQVQQQSPGECYAAPHIHQAAATQQLPQQQQQQYHLVIADDNMQYRSMRCKCCTLARTAGAAAVLLHLRCPEALAQQRNAARPPAQRVPAEVIARMAARLEAPGGGGSGSSSGGSSDDGGITQPASSSSTHGRGSSDSSSTSQAQEQDLGSGSSEGSLGWEQRCLVTWHSSQPMSPAGTAGLWQQVWQRWGPPLPPPPDAQAEAAARAAAQAATAASALHAVDLATRQVLSESMRRLAPAGQQHKAAAAQQLNAARRKLMQAAAVAVAADTSADQEGAAPAAAAAAAAEQWAQDFRRSCERIIDALS